MAKGALAKAVSGLAFAYGAFHFYTAWAGPLDPIAQRSLLIGVGIILAFVFYPANKAHSSLRVSWWQLVFIIVTIICTGYFFANSERIMIYPVVRSLFEIGISVLFFVVLLVATRRAIGLVIPVVVVVLFLYAWLGHYAPGALQHRQMDFTMVVGMLFISAEGIWGLIPGVMTNIVAIFILFGAMVLRCGLGKVLIDLVLSLGGRSVGGAAKVAVLGSALFGTVSGSAVANVALTGSMTIPMMKGLGYKPEFAGATEAAASTGGQIMPPIMGAAAFLMATLIGIPYVYIIAAAALPAVIYFFGVWMTVHLFAVKIGMKGLPKEQVPPLRSLLTPGKAGRLALPLGILLFLLFQGFTPNMAGFWATVAVIVPYLFSDFTKQGMKRRLWHILKGVEDGGRGLVVLAVLAGSAQIIVALTTMTPLVVLFSQAVLAIAGDLEWVILVLVMLLALIFGMGLPTTAAYVVAVAMALPLMLTLGFDVLASHLFIFYFAVMSGLTPPVCAAIYIAAPMAGANWLKTAGQGLVLACAGFLVPFVFIYSPALLLSGSVTEIILVAISTAAAVGCISAVFMQYLKTKSRLYETGLLLVASALFLTPGLASSLIALILLMLVYALQHYRLITYRRKLSSTSGNSLNQDLQG